MVLSLLNHGDSVCTYGRYNTQEESFLECILSNFYRPQMKFPLAEVQHISRTYSRHSKSLAIVPSYTVIQHLNPKGNITI